MAEALLTARELAGELDVSSETVLRWTRRGELPAIRLPGGAIRFRRDALDAWLDARSIGPENCDGPAEDGAGADDARASSRDERYRP